MSDNNKAIIAKVTEVREIPGADNIHIAVVLGEQCIVSKSVHVGYEGVLFPPELQLSEEFCYENNLNRDSEKNKDKTKKGFFDTNRKVRVQPFMKVRSEAFFIAKESLAYVGGVENLALGTTFNEVNGKQICKKYINSASQKAIGNVSTKISKKMMTPFFPEHVDTAHFKYEVNKIKKGDIIYFHSKKHGTSGRTSNTKVFKDLPKWKKLVNNVFPVFKEYEWEVVTGSRRVIFKNSEKIGDSWHGSNAFRFEISEMLKPYLEKGMTCYFEIVGFVNGSPIMPQHDVKALKNKEYTKKYGDKITYAYGCKEHQYKIHVYRITQLDCNNNIRDLSQKEVEKWCNDRDIGYTVDVHEPIVYDGDELKLRGLVDNLTEKWDTLTEDHEYPDQISEGIILRVDNGNQKPLFMKSKSNAFRTLEGIDQELNIEDIS